MPKPHNNKTKLINALEQLALHDHLCLIYETREEQFNAVIPFIRAGLESGEKCIYIVDDNTAATVLDAMRTDGIDVDSAVKSGRLSIATKQEAYLKQGYFDPEWMINFLKEAADTAKREGYPCLRVTGEMTWVFGGDPGVERLIEYEAKLNYFCPEKDMLVICQYNRNRFSPEIIIDVIRTHPLVIFKDTVCKNFYYVPPDDFLKPGQSYREAERLLDNILERSRVEEKLREREYRYRTLFDEINEGFALHEIICNKKGEAVDYRFLEINPAFETMTGMKRDNVIGKRVLEVLPNLEKYWIESYGKVALTRIPVKFQNYARELGKYFEVAAFSPQKGQFATLFTDITDKKKLEDQLRHAQKMEAVGQLAGGIAHDFNNILTTIIGYGDFLRDETPEGSSLKTYADQILTAADNAAGLTRGLLAFSRKQVIATKPVNLNEIIRRVEKLLLRLIGEDIELKTALTEKDLTIMADRGQIEQVLMNLCANARDAMPNGGILTIDTGFIEIDDAFIKAHGFGKEGMYALISVADTGMGMDEKTRERIFEPFFTTKGPGRGTGLGLSTAYGIIKNHDGYINCYSEMGKGTIFRIYLPITKAGIEDAKAAALPPLRGGTETVLIAEDDADVRKLMKDVLIGFGYRVIEAADGEAALKAFKENMDKLRIIILDVIMPKKCGKEVYQEIKKMSPDIKAVFTSGYTEDIIKKTGILEEGLNFISKPVSPSELLRKVREVLDT
ncbi:MAG: MEDS domain-containing protein [Nitrospinae bacterium]|nr:MEDS domain-containing protein [Nitrospinota bacterium]